MEETGATQPLAPAVAASNAKKKPFYTSLSWQVLFGIAVAIVLGIVKPATAVAMKPLGDGFIRLITMIIAVIIFCTVVTGIAGMEDMKKVGRVGCKALLYFEVISTLALLLGLIVGNVVQPGAGFNVNPAMLDTKAVADYAGQAKAQSVPDFILHIITNTIVDAFTRGDILQVLLVAILFGFALSSMGPRCKHVVDLFDGMTHAVFGVVNIVMRLAPIGAFGAMAFTVGRYGITALGPLLKLATSSSEPALPTLMNKMEKLGCSKSLVGLVVPTGYTFNTDGSSMYMTLAALFIAQATNIHLTLGQQLTIFIVAVLTSQGASGVQGAAFIALVGTLTVIPTIPVAGMALLLGIDRFMSMFRAMVNMLGNGVATLVVARWEKEIDGNTLAKNMASPLPVGSVPVPVKAGQTAL